MIKKLGAKCEFAASVQDINFHLSKLPMMPFTWLKSSTALVCGLGPDSDNLELWVVDADGSLLRNHQTIEYEREMDQLWNSYAGSWFCNPIRYIAWYIIRRENLPSDLIGRPDFKPQA